MILNQNYNKIRYFKERRAVSVIAQLTKESDFRFSGHFSPPSCVVIFTETAGKRSRCGGNNSHDRDGEIEKLRVLNQK